MLQYPLQEILPVTDIFMEVVMRFEVLQQIGGPRWLVYDTMRMELVRGYDGKYAKEYAIELQVLLNRGVESVHDAVTATAPVLPVRDAIQSQTKRRKVLQRSMQSNGEEV
jgi:hypothetical protein